jgi:hypothetical protein
MLTAQARMPVTDFESALPMRQQYSSLSNNLIDDESAQIPGKFDILRRRRYSVLKASSCMYSNIILNYHGTRQAFDMAPINQPTVNESPHPARLGRGLHHETNYPHTLANQLQAQSG